jgi:hypothetical protein
VREGVDVIKRWAAPVWVCAVACVLAACASGVDPRLLGSSESQLKMRAIQSRAFDSGDALRTLKTVMATLQDLGFVLDKADSTMGTVSGTKLNEYALRITVTVRQKGDTQVVVRANAQLNQDTVADPKPYQEFFAALEKAMFLTAHQVD